MKWGVVLGASSGSGAAIAATLAERNGLHILAAHRGNWPEGAAEVTARVQACGRQIEWLELDASHPEAAEAGVERLAGRGGTCAVFVHAIAAAAVGPLVTGDSLHPRQLDTTFRRMAHSFLYWASALHRHDRLDPDGALLLALGNPMVDTVVRNTGAIAASKAALETYVRHLAFELGPLGHRVNLLKYGLTVTPALEATFGAAGVARLREVVEQVVHNRRLADLQEVANIVSHLAKPEARWFNGATIDFTGGEAQALFDALVHR
ncbi:MAG: NAD(P)-dependent dehydrogenase (short-subunit alcohol dehydrogenase family) [Myxococcota bacterium]|jgi:NAD(P)-dependent dehydrogenase (short-subunit alcohol dehydrogenase family)